MKVSVILYHSNILTIYKKQWIQKCIQTIMKQTYKDFDLYELNYGNDNVNLKELFKISNKKHFYYKIKMNNHAEAMNFLLDTVFIEKEYNICFNVNLDDFYALNRFEKQIEAVKEGYELISSEYKFVHEIGGIDNIGGIAGLSMDSIDNLFKRDITPMAHPCVCFTKEFWIKYGKYIPSEIPREDKLLWIRSYNNNAKLCILKDSLLFYRIHTKQISGNNI
jgi:hypothetical protein